MPAKFEQPFAPEKELKKAKEAPREERRERLAEFKERLVAQKEGIAKTQAELMNAIRANPDMSRQEFNQHLEAHGKEIGLTEEQKRVARATFVSYEKMHHAVNSVREKYADDAELYKAVFGRMPHGEVKVSKGPMTLYFRCYDPDDYSFIWSRVLHITKKDEVREEDRIAASRTGGVHINTTLIPELRGTVIAENTSRVSKRKQAEVEIHEEQHAIRRLFHDKVHKSMFVGIFEQVKPDNKDEARAMVEGYLRELRQDAEVHLKNELLAYLKSGAQHESILKSFTRTKEEKGNYDYLESLRERDVLRWSRLWLPEFKNVVPAAIQMVFVLEYRALVRRGIASFQLLTEKLGYRPEEATALLLHEPLRKWWKVVSRLYEQKQKQKTGTKQ